MLTEITLDRNDFLKKIENIREGKYGYDSDLLQRKLRYTTCKEIEEHLESSQFNIDLKGYHYECLFSRKEGKNLYVIYDGARKGNFPGFPRWGYHRLFSGSMLCIEDPLYYIYPDIQLGWYYGTKELSLIELSLSIVRAVCHHENIAYENIIFFSSSGGGYAGIYAATIVDKTLAIALNPQLYIQNYSQRQSEYFRTLGIDLNKEDILKRNDLPSLLRKSKSKFFLLFNAQSEHDWNHHLKPFMEEMNIVPQYGIVQKNNILLWIYDAVGVPYAHTSFETKAIFSFIDQIGKKFYLDKLTEEDRKNIFTVNENWHEIYSLRKMNKDRYSQEFIFGGRKEISISAPYERKKIFLNPKNKDFNFYRYDLSKKIRFAQLFLIA